MNHRETPLPIGTPVRIVEYGSMHYEHVNGDIWRAIDLSPELVGQTGRIREVSTIQGRNSYAIDGPNKTAWYFDDQLEEI